MSNLIRQHGHAFIGTAALAVFILLGLNLKADEPKKVGFGDIRFDTPMYTAAGVDKAIEEAGGVTPELYELVTNAFDTATNAVDTASRAYILASSTYDIATNAYSVAADSKDASANAYDIATNACAIATASSATATLAYLTSSNAYDLAADAYTVTTNTYSISTNAADIATDAYTTATNTSAELIYKADKKVYVDSWMCFTNGYVDTNIKLYCRKPFPDDGTQLNYTIDYSRYNASTRFPHIYVTYEPSNPSRWILKLAAETLAVTNLPWTTEEIVFSEIPASSGLPTTLILSSRDMEDWYDVVYSVSVPAQVGYFANDVGYVTSSITNGLVTATVTNGLVTASITNGLVTAAITNGVAFTNDIILSPVFGNGSFTDWVIDATGSEYEGTTLEIIWDGSFWILHSNGAFIDPPAPDSGDEYATYLNFNVQHVIATRTRTDIVGYNLGSQTNIVLAAPAITNGLVTASVTNGVSKEVLDLQRDISPLLATNQYALFVIDLNPDGSNKWSHIELKASTNNFENEETGLMFYCPTIANGVPSYLDLTNDWCRLFAMGSKLNPDVRKWVAITNTQFMALGGYPPMTLSILIDPSLFRRHQGGEWMNRDNDDIIWSYVRIGDGEAEKDEYGSQRWRAVMPVRWYSKPPSWANQDPIGNLQ